MKTSSHSRIVDLLLAWKEADEQGRNLSAEELCADCPELLPDLRRRIAEVVDMKRRLAEMTASLSEVIPVGRNVDDVRAELVEHHLVTPEQWELALEVVPEEQRSAAWPLIQQLVGRGVLTCFQAERVARGRTGELALGNYILLERIGEGGMGQVFEARHRRMNRLVALKLLSPGLTRTPAAAQRFQREVETAARLLHPNIVTAFDADEVDGTHFLVMELVDGDDLARLVHRDGPAPVAKGIHYILQAARGLEYAHLRGVVHRDIKPSNLLLDNQGVVKVLDMGLARFREETDDPARTELTATGMVMGTADYMAPEQALDTKQADQRSDIYSLGCTLIFLLTGKPAYAGESVFAKLLAHREQPLPSLSAMRREVPERLDDTLGRMIAKAPDDRFQSMTEVVAELETCLAQEPTFQPDPGMAAALERDHGQPPAPPTRVGLPEDATAISDSPTLLLESDQDALAALASAAGGNRRGVGNRPPRRLARLAGPIALFCVGAAVALLIYLSTVYPVTRPKGTVLLKWDQPGIAGAEVFVNNEQAFTISTVKGQERFVFPVDGRTHELRVEKAGFAPFIQNIVARSEETFPLAVRLAPLAAASDRIADAEPPPAVMPPVDYALSFDGVDDYVELTTLKLPRGPITLELWASPRIGEKSFTLLNGIGDAGAAIYLRPTAGFCAAYQAGLIYEDVIRTNGTAYYHVALVSDGTVFQLFVDGVPSGKASPKTPDATPRGISFLGTEQNWAGGAPDKPNLNRLFAGRLDEVRISTIARYTGDFTPSRRFVSDEHTLALYHCDGGQGSVLKDSSGHGHHGKIVGATWGPTDAMAPADPDRRAAEWVLSIGGAVRMNNETRDLNDVSELPPDGFHLTWVFLKGNPQVSEAGLACFQDCENVRYLWLDNTKISDAGLAHFQNCKNLGGLAVSNATQVTDAGLAHFQSCKNLTHLDFDHTQITDAGLAYFQDCERLMYLDLRGTKISDAGLVHVQGRETLNALLLAETQVSDAGLARFQNCKALTLLDLDHTEITDAGLAYFQECKNLVFFDLNATRISDAGLERLVGLTKLEELYLWKTQVTAQAVNELHKKIPQCAIYWDGGVIEPEKRAASPPTSDSMDAAMAADSPDRRAAEWVLSMGGTVRTNIEDRKITDAKMLPPADFQLVGFSLEKNQQVTDAGLVHFEGCKNLKTVGLSNTQIGDAGLAHFQGCTELTHLELGGTNVSDAGLAYFHNCKKLLVLGLHRTNVSDGGAAHFQGCKSLISLDLSNTKITDAGLSDFEDCTNLTHLYLGDANIGDAGLACFQDCKKLLVLWLYGTNVTDDGLAHFQDCKSLAGLNLHNTEIGDAGLAYFEGRGNMRYLDLRDTQVGDAGLAYFQDCKNLDLLDLRNTKISDAGLVQFQDYKNLSILLLSGTQVSDAGLADLRDCKNLSILWLEDMKITDAGLERLAGLTTLGELHLHHTPVTTQGVGDLHKQLPQCTIYWDGDTFKPE